jgi:tetratricopeptide (TPR) repeat protein
MLSEGAPRRFRRLRWVARGLLVALLGMTAWVCSVQWTARSNLDRGRAALAADDPASARELLDRCLETWPSSAEAHFRAAQAARRCEDFQSATDHLDQAVKLGWDDSAAELERALIQARSGGLRLVEHILVRYVLEGHADAPHIFAVLVPAYAAEFRWSDAGAMAEKWVQLRPGSAQAWSQHGEILSRLRKKEAAADAFRQAVRLDPNDPKARLGLARALLDLRQPTPEATEQLEWLREKDPDNTSVLVLLALCWEGQGQTDEAAGLLDRVIAEFPPHPKAFLCRGRLELNRGRPAAGLPFLRRAAGLDPSDVETLYSLAQCLRQVGAAEEAHATEERWRRAEADLKRVAELARSISSSPRDPDLRREMGELFLRNGRDKDGLRWLESALREQPDHASTHQQLADYYERTGQREIAAYHRSVAAGKSR